MARTIPDSLDEADGIEYPRETCDISTRAESGFTSEVDEGRLGEEPPGCSLRAAVR